MAARVITITSGKGGVGKTTATANLGVALATLGHRVVCVDADIGLRNLDVVMGLENRIVYDLVDVVEGRAKLRQAMIKDKRLKDELYLIPAAQTRDKTAVSPSDMVRLCDELRTVVDFVLIDSPAGIERGFRNAIAPADEVIIVTNPEVSSVRDADRIIGLIEAENKGPGRLIINRVKPEMVKRGDMLSPEDIIDILAIKLIGLVPEDETILISTNRGVPVALSVDESKSGRAFLDIARRVLGEDVPFLPLDEEAGLFQRMFRKLGLASGAQPTPAPAPAAGQGSKAVKPEASEPSPPVKEATGLEASEPPSPVKEAARPEASEPPSPVEEAAKPEAGKAEAVKPQAEKPAPASPPVASPPTKEAAAPAPGVESASTGAQSADKAAPKAAAAPANPPEAKPASNSPPPPGEAALPAKPEAAEATQEAKAAVAPGDPPAASSGKDEDEKGPAGSR